MMHRDKEIDGPSVVLSHGGVQYSYQTALALQQAGFLKAFWTTLYDFNGRHSAFLSKRYLGRRHYQGLEKELVYSNPWPELVQRTLTVLLGKNYLTTSHVVHFRNRLFDGYVARQLEKLDFNLFIGLSGSTLDSLGKTKSLGKMAVVDQHDIHYVLAARLLEEERRLHPEFASSIPYWPPLKRYLDCVERELQVADFILVPSSFSLRSHLEAAIPKEKLILVLHGLSPSVSDPPEVKRKRDQFRMLFVGTLTQRKGIKYLLEAVKQIRLPRAELFLIGDQMVSRTALAPYQSYFQYVGYVSYHEVKNYFANAHVLVLPSVYDAFGLVVLDGMAAGLPVIVSEHTAAGSDIVRDGVDGFVVPIRDVEALKDRIVRLYENPTLRAEMGRNAWERAKQFSWDVYQNRLRTVVEQIFQSSHLQAADVS